MPYKLRWEGHGVYRRFFGVVSSAEFREAHAEMTGDLRYECIRYIISDYLEAEPGPDLTDTFLGRVEQLQRLEYDCGPDIVHATVADGEKMLTHIRYFESLPLAPYPEATFATRAGGEPRRGWAADEEVDDSCAVTRRDATPRSGWASWRVLHPRRLLLTLVDNPQGDGLGALDTSCRWNSSDRQTV